jgi:predicted transcriptional regulator
MFVAWQGLSDEAEEAQWPTTCDEFRSDQIKKSTMQRNPALELQKRQFQRPLLLDLRGTQAHGTARPLQHRAPGRFGVELRNEPFEHLINHI